MSKNFPFLRLEVARVRHFNDVINIELNCILQHLLSSLKSALVDIGRVLLDWIAGFLNPDCNPIWWIGLWLTIQSQNRILDLDCQSSFVISFQIQNIRIIFSRNYNLILVYQIPTMKPTYFLSKFSSN